MSKSKKLEEYRKLICDSETLMLKALKIHAVLATTTSTKKEIHGAKEEVETAVAKLYGTLRRIHEAGIISREDISCKEVFLSRR